MSYVDPLIWKKDKTLCSDFCNHVIDKFENDERKHIGLVGFERRTSPIKKSVDLNISYYDEWKDEDSIFYNSLKENFEEYTEHCNQYKPYFPYAFVGAGINQNTKDSGYQIQRTKPGEYYKWHHDGWIEKKFLRLVTYIWYLNDIKEDGYTEFSNGMKIQPEQGKILIFPATWTYIHQGFPPKSETKYICTGWISYEVVR
jgi:hypothetical protein